MNTSMPFGRPLAGKTVLFLAVLLSSAFFLSPAQAAIDLRIDGQADPVSLFATVTDAQGNYVTDLTEGNFQITENGDPVDILTFTQPAAVGSDTVGLSAVLVVDDSGSLTDANRFVDQSVISFIRHMNLGDRLALIRFNGDPYDMFDGFTVIDPADTTALEEAVTRPLAFNDATVAFDSLDQALNVMEATTDLPNGPKVIILMSDGRDNASQIDLDTIRSRVEASTFPLFVVGFGNTNETTLVPLAQAGGTEYIASRDQNAFDAVQLELAKLLQNGYSMTYGSNVDLGPPCSDIQLDFVVNAAQLTEQSVQSTFTRCAPANQAPHIRSIFEQTFRRGAPVALSIEASDVDGDPLTFSATGLPPGISLNTSTGELTGAPTQLGTYVVQVGVTDDTSTSRIAFTANVIEPQSQLDSTDGGGGGAFGLWGLFGLLATLLVAIPVRRNLRA